MIHDFGGPSVPPGYASEYLARMKKKAKEKKEPESEEHLGPAGNPPSDSSCEVPDDLNDNSRK